MSPRDRVPCPSTPVRAGDEGEVNGWPLAGFCWAHRHGLRPEAELGQVGGKDGAHHPNARTDPDQVRAYAGQTGVDMLAVAVGSRRAMTERAAALDQELIT